MARKHKHEEHVNHERWLVSYADMMTLLFALFVVLYALGSVELTKLQQLRASVRWAFHIAGDGKTKDTGIFENQTGGGDVMHAVPLLTAQSGEMREFLKEVLPEYEEVTGRSLKYNQSDDTVSLTAPMSDLFEANSPAEVKRGVQAWLRRAVVASLTFASDVQVTIETPELPIGANSRGEVVTSVQLCERRLQVLRRLIQTCPEIRDHMIETRFRTMQDVPGGVGARNWEDVAVVRLAFTNGRSSAK
ncbi:MAG: hypothetical protein FJ265_09840 [Planctomycetes bacterium]|nr:hypothetical protein [Planctomycetota bacterium]